MNCLCDRSQQISSHATILPNRTWCYGANCFQFMAARCRPQSTVITYSSFSRSICWKCVRTTWSLAASWPGIPTRWQPPTRRRRELTRKTRRWPTWLSGDFSSSLLGPQSSQSSTHGSYFTPPTTTRYGHGLILFGFFCHCKHDFLDNTFINRHIQAIAAATEVSLFSGMVFLRCVPGP